MLHSYLSGDVLWVTIHLICFGFSYGASEAGVVFRRLTEISEYERGGRLAGRGHAFEWLISQHLTDVHAVIFVE